VKRSRLVIALGLALVALVAGASCSDRAAPGVTTPPASATPAAGTADALPSSLRQMLQDVATVRKLTPPPDLKAELVSRSDLPALLERLLTEDDRRWFDNTTTLYRLLGHLRRDQDYHSVWQSFGSGSVLGLYSPIDKQLWIVHDDGASIDFDHLPRQEKETLAHELVHAVQDYHFQLDKVYEAVVDDLDRNLAWTAVVEGDAVTHEAIYGQRFTAIPSPSGRAFLVASFGQARDVPPSIERELYFPYTTGAAWIRAIVQKTGTQTVDAMLADPPAGTAFVLHPELLENGWQPARMTLPDAGPALGNGWKRQSSGTWGEFGIQNYLLLHLRGLDAANAANGWNGDHYDVYVSAAESVAVFRVKFRDATEAREFADAQQSFLRAARATMSTEGTIALGQTPDGNVTATIAPNGDEVIFTIGSSPDAALRAMRALVKG
jgi:hypothetical protein